MARRQLGTNDFWWPDGLLARNTAMVSSVRELRVLRPSTSRTGPNRVSTWRRRIGDRRAAIQAPAKSFRPLDGEPKRVDWGSERVGPVVDARATRVTPSGVLSRCPVAPTDRIALTGAASNRGMTDVPPIIAWRWSQLSGPEVQFDRPDAPSTDIQFKGGFPAFRSRRQNRGGP